MLRRSEYLPIPPSAPTTPAAPAPAQDGERVFNIRDLRIDVDRHEVTKRDRVLKLTARSFELLVYLARYRATALTRDRLLAHVWGCGPGGAIRTVSRARYRLDEGEPAPGSAP